MHVKSSCFDKNNIIPRNPLKPTARRAGWQGCYLNFNNFVLFGHLNIKRVSLESNDP